MRIAKRIALVLLPLAAIAGTATWWRGDSSRSRAAHPAPLAPPRVTPAQAAAPAPAAARRPPPPPPPVPSSEVTASARTAERATSDGDAAAPSTEIAGATRFELGIPRLVLQRWAPGAWPLDRNATAPPEEAKKLEVVQRIENGASIFALEARSADLPADGPITTHHENGAKASAGTMRNGKRVGAWCEWHPNGEKSAEGAYFHGTRHGFWSHWHDDGHLREAGEYLYGRKEGLWTSWYPSGQKQRVAHYRNDRAEGRASEWHADGTKASEGAYEDDLREGLWLEWHPDGALASRGSYRRGRLEGRWELWDETGELDLGASGLYRDGWRIGE